MPDAAKDLEFLVAMVKTGTLTVNYDDAGAFLGWNKRQCIKKMCQFRKDYDWPVDKSAPKAAAPKAAAPKAAGKSPAAKAPKRAAEDGEVKKPAAKRAKASKKAAKEEEEEAVKDVEVPAAEQAEVFEEGAEDEY